MGIVNVTPDSFSDGGEFLDPEKAIDHGLRLTAEGAALIDVGGESTRPLAEPVPVEVEMKRVLPVVEGLVAEGVVVGIDTYKPEVAEAALGAGAQVVNDVTACRSEEMARLIAHASCAVLVMHMGEAHLDRSQLAAFDDVVSEVEEFLLATTRRLIYHGIDPSRIAVDPGIGFGKRPEHSVALIAGLARLSAHGFPVVLGVSRKRFLETIVGERDPADRDLASAVTTAIGFSRGARVFRVHDVASSLEALQVAEAVEAVAAPPHHSVRSQRQGS